jgi:hypothetical protein
MVQKVSKVLDLNLSKIKGANKVSRKKQALEEIGEYILDQILSHVGSAKSPVEGGKYKSSLDPDYAKIKKKISGSSKPNMELYGDMLDEMAFKVNKRNKLEIGFLKDSDQTQIDKADNHNKFSSASKKTKLPERNFIPRKSDTFKKSIMTEVDRIIEDYASEDN